MRLLKAALNADLVDQALADPVLAEAMDLCVACKGCKRECENNVDMALIKAEFSAQRHARRRPGLRTRLFAHLPRWQHRHPWMGWLVRWRNRRPWLARLGERRLGIDARARLPEPVPRSAPRGARGIGEWPGAADRSALPEVVLLIDTFTRYYEPDVGEATQLVLDAAGYQVRAVAPDPADAEPDRPLCCGRTYLAQGLIGEARREARRLLDALLSEVRAGRLVVGLEREHARIAREMAEQALFPALRAAPSARVVANGFSWRRQILEQGTHRPPHLSGATPARPAVHPAEPFPGRFVEESCLSKYFGWATWGVSGRGVAYSPTYRKGSACRG